MHAGLADVAVQAALAGRAAVYDSRGFRVAANVLDHHQHVGAVAQSEARLGRRPVVDVVEVADEVARLDELFELDRSGRGPRDQQGAGRGCDCRSDGAPDVRVHSGGNRTSALYRQSRHRPGVGASVDMHDAAETRRA